MRRNKRNLPKFKDFDELNISIPNTKVHYKKKYKVVSPVETGTQNCLEVSGTFVTTDNPNLSHVGITHVEGGWPKDINRLDEEQTARYRKKQEKDENYLNQMKGMIKTCEHAIFQNNAINLYENYFDDLETIDLKEEYNSKTLNIYRDKTKRGIRKIVWTPDEPTHFASCHCGEQNYYNYLIGEENTLNVWNVEYTKAPIVVLNSHAQSHCLEYNPKDPPCLVSGMVTGQVSAFDVRVNNSFPVMLSRREISHRDRVNAVTFYCSKTNMEFFSGSAAGEIFWWDLRNLEAPIDTLLLNPKAIVDGIKNDDKAFGINALEYESTIPNKYMVGTEAGVVFICNKRFKTPADRIYAKIQCCHGTVSAVQRNPSFLKFFLSVGDWQAKIWCEELKDSPIFWTKEYVSELIYGCWNSVRCSSFYLCRMDGWLDAWDVINRSDRPVLTTKLSDHALLTCSPHNSGKWVACGSSNGDIHLVEVSENLATSTVNDRPAMAVVLDRETRREKLLENKQRELKLKEKEKEREQIRARLGLANPEEIELNLANELAKQAEISFHQQIDALKPHC